jgi:hypothetical protein
VQGKAKLIKPAVAVAGVMLLAGLGGFAPMRGDASGHREAPHTAADPQIDGTDLYAFVSPDKPGTVTFISNWLPFQVPSGGPTFYPFADGARYDLNVDNDGDARADVTYRWTFSSRYRKRDTYLYNTGPVTALNDPDLNFRQFYDLERVGGGVTRRLLDDAPVAPSHVGTASMPDYGALRRQAVRRVGSPGGLSFAGQADDPSFLDLRMFDLLYGADLSEIGRDTLAGYNVNTIALQVPVGDLVRGEGTIGVWATAHRRGLRAVDAAGGRARGEDWVQVSRLGMPLRNDVIVPAAARDRFNASAPAGDAQFLPAVTRPELARRIESVYKIPAPKTPRDDLVSVFLTGVNGLNRPANPVQSEMLRLNTGIRASRDGRRLGVIDGDRGGFPNGRRLADDVVDIALQIVEGELVGLKNDLGDGVDANDKPFEPAFPYVALPHAGSGTGPHLPEGGVATGGGGTAGGLPLPAAAAAAVGLAAAAAAGTALALRRRPLPLPATPRAAPERPAVAAPPPRQPADGEPDDDRALEPAALEPAAPGGDPPGA